ncbi:hypothetical protein ABIF63_005764 [Bradyrhizobium japonicum]|uniref:Uncharacterized protein n=1 Tax=Bradyrhizobium japonicum TaxID=375 RepID=A0ABV2RXJ4_BRAJP|nr:hypothetical protein [Bradyrhizobium japonicum]UQD95247.1 hypothetical protein JEY30_26885 [Bradyrhizobium japonicum]WLB23442.1 hypothetical protein QIH95_22380 [Bradyrhizobium japonicum]
MSNEANTAMRDHCTTNGIVDNSPLRDVRVYKVFHPHPMIYSFNRDGLMHFASATEYDRTQGKYASNNNSFIRKCDALYLDEHQRESAREVQWFVGPNKEPDLSINGETLLRIISQRVLTTPDHSFEAPKDLLLFFEKHTNSLNNAERMFNSYVDQLATRFPDKCHERRK